MGGGELAGIWCGGGGRGERAGWGCFSESMNFKIDGWTGGNRSTNTWDSHVPTIEGGSQQREGGEKPDRNLNLGWCYSRIKRKKAGQKNWGYQ